MTRFLFSQVADFDWPHKHMPDLEKLVDLCRNLDSWLRADLQNVIVVHCHVRGDGGREEGRERGRERKTNVIRQACLVSFRDCPIVEAFHVCEEKKVGEERRSMEREGRETMEKEAVIKGLTPEHISCTKCSFTCRTVIPSPP